ncbi:uncharacterized protein LOC125681526 isoform X2 [Ostrea edulis]|uniref:uncharacterized protein LOC125681526 isoform X2 n=1 Tax=Ostrea edulis TaxID=37623 RepID=UPI002094F337|nr:uncharacterized protein LOC125681526 isoform X2 [Ostrea edulis]
MTDGGVCGFQDVTPVCCTHYHLVNGSCEECTEGYFGSNCTVCFYPSYGLSCRYKCECAKSFCDHKYGCLEYVQSTTSTTEHLQPTISTTEHLQSTVSTNERIVTRQELTSLVTKGTVATWTSTSSKPRTLVQTTPTVASDHISMTSVIIIIGSMLCFFLFLIAANQIHSKIQRQRTLGRRKYRKKLPDSPKAEDVYQVISESHVSELINKYDVVLESQSERLSTQDVNSEYTDVDNPDLTEKHYDYTEEYDSCEILREEESFTGEIRWKDDETDEKSSISIPSACVPGTVYLESVAQQNTYLELIDETSNGTTDLHAQDNTYLDVVNK